MKINFFNLAIAITISGLITYGLFNIDANATNTLMIVGCFMGLSITSTFVIGITSELPRTAVNLKVTGGVFFLIMILLNVIFFVTNFSNASYIVSSGITLLIFALVARTMFTAKL